MWLTEEDAGSARLSATREGDGSNAAALIEGDELVKVVEIGEHLPKNMDKVLRIAGHKNTTCCVSFLPG